MVHPWIKTFFKVGRELAVKRLAALPSAQPIGWDGTIQDHLTPEEWKSFDQEITEQLKEKNDRSLAIASASMVEERLRWLIETKFIDGLSQTKKDRIFTGLGPLSSFTAKIEVAYALGLLKPEMREQLQIISKIRNKFAHNFRRIRFTDQEIASLCETLRKFDKEGYQRRAELRELYGFSCIICGLALLVTGQLVLASRPGLSLSPKKSE